jgi:hypothetical protein
MLTEEETIRRLVGSQRDCGFSLKFVLQKQGNDWRVCSALIKLIKSCSVKGGILDYGNYLFGEIILSIDDGLKTISYLYNDMKLLIPNIAEFVVITHDRMQLLCSRQKHWLFKNEWSTNLSSFNVIQSNQGSPSADELLKEGLPYYPNLSDAIIDFLNLSTDYFQNYGTIYIQLSDYRARISELRLVFSKVYLIIETPEISNEKLVVKCFGRAGSKITAIGDLYPKDGKVEFEVGFRPDNLNIALLSREDGTKIDGKELGTWRSAEDETIIIERSEEEILFLAKKGENQNLEYKLNTDDEKKKTDLVETVVAFSNTDGGLLIVGVANDGSILGCNQNKEDLLKMIHDSIDPPPQNIAISEKAMGSNKIITIEIPEGNNPPYQSKRDKNMYVRHNANDMRIERSELIELLERHKNNQPHTLSY